MATSAVDDLITELEAALAVLDPQVRGLQDLENVSITEELKTQVNAELTNRQRRQGLIRNLLIDLHLLINDGYPDMPQAPLSSSLFNELQGEESDIEAGAGVFRQELAASLGITLGQPTDKPQTEEK